ncbi:MAG: hypothetical protein HKP25_06995, partial [Marinicaulis sp.]|nr:hypothetical protein [Marinicaulis sp.]
YYEDKNFTERVLPAPVIAHSLASHDWEGMRADVHDDLLEASRATWKSDDEIERERAYDKPRKSMYRDTREENKHSNDDIGEDVAAKVMARAGKGLSVAQRVYGTDRAADLDLIGER